jgi:aquaporin Z
MLRKLLVEAIGTFFLAFTIGMVVLEPGGAGALAPLAIGMVLIVMIYAGGHISGAHYNPAITLGVLLRGRSTPTEMIGYWTAQILAAAAAALLVPVIKGNTALVAAAPETGPTILAEFMFTFALVYVVLNVATAKGTHGNSYFGLAIGGTVMAGAWAVGPVSGGAFNPAVAVALVLYGVVPATSLPIYFVATLLGGACAGLLFNALDLGDDKPTTAAGAQAGLKGAAVPIDR